MSLLLNQENKANHLFELAEKHWTDGELHRAFRLFLAAAKAGFVPAFDIVAQFYDNGWGVKTNFDAALDWYEQAYRNGPSWYRQAHQKGLATVANNIGCILRDKRKLARAISWFERAVKFGDGDANLNIAKIYLLNRPDRGKAIHYLQKTIKAAYVTDGSIEQAKALLKQIRTKRLPLSEVILPSRSVHGPGNHANEQLPEISKQLTQKEMDLVVRI